MTRRRGGSGDAGSVDERDILGMVQHVRVRGRNPPSAFLVLRLALRIVLGPDTTAHPRLGFQHSNAGHVRLLQVYSQYNRRRVSVAGGDAGGDQLRRARAWCSTGS